MLRHIFLSDKYLNHPKDFNLKDMMETAEKMGHSLQQSLEYVKK